MGLVGMVRVGSLLMTGLLGANYSMNQASYNLARLRRNGLITRIPHHHYAPHCAPSTNTSTTASPTHDYPQQLPDTLTKYQSSNNQESLAPLGRTALIEISQKRNGETYSCRTVSLIGSASTKLGIRQFHAVLE
jgi:hypothetical protein